MRHESQGCKKRPKCGNFFFFFTAMISTAQFLKTLVIRCQSLKNFETCARLCQRKTGIDEACTQDFPSACACFFTHIAETLIRKTSARLASQAHLLSCRGQSPTQAVNGWAQTCEWAPCFGRGGLFLHGQENKSPAWWGAQALRSQTQLRQMMMRTVRWPENSTTIVQPWAFTSC